MQKTQVMEKKEVVQQKDRLGFAVVSLIAGIFSSLFFFLFFLNGIAGIENDVMIMMYIFSVVLALVSFPLGFMARKSPKGRGVAIAGMTLSFVPLLFFALSIIV